MPAARILKLQLTRFRSYEAAQMRVGNGPVVLTGPNGAGKTNVLEAISLLSPGRGLRRAHLSDIAHVEPAQEGQGQAEQDQGAEAQRGAARQDGQEPFSSPSPFPSLARSGWAVSALVDGALGEARLGTGMDDGAEGPRRCRIDGEAASSANAFLDHLKVVWLTPEMDGLFLGPPSDRRRYLDRLVLAVDATHGTRVNGLERALRARNRLLEESGAPRFLDAVEHEVAELAVAVAAARIETVARLSAEIAAHRDETSLFPFAEIALDGALERRLAEAPAVEVEDRYRAILREMRPRDRAAGRTLEGPHLTDLSVRHGLKRLPAARCSTGEQKSLLIGLTLSHARLVAAMGGLAPVLLLDDVVAYLDAERRTGLFAALLDLGAQVWMTGADPSAFGTLSTCERFMVEAGEIRPAG